MFDVLISGGLVVDGTGGPAHAADVGVEGDRIGAVGSLQHASAVRTVDARGMVVAPGFIDVHTHSDFPLLVDPRGLSKLRQGVTTDLVGHCGMSPFPASVVLQRRAQQQAQNSLGQAVEWTWVDLAGYRAALERQGIGLNVAPLVGHSPIRSTVVGFDDRPATADELHGMQRLVAEAMEQGAFGLSTGLTFPPGAYGDTDEVVALCQAMAAFPGRIYDTHQRAPGRTLLSGSEEALAIGRRAGVPVQLAHMAINDPRQWGQAGARLAEIEKAAEGMDVTCDVYPYAASSSGFSQCLPTWAQSGGRQALAERLRDPETRTSIRADMLRNGVLGGLPWMWDRFLICGVENDDLRPYVGLTIQQVAEEMGCDPLDAALTLMDRDEAHMRVIWFYRTEEDMRTFLSHPLVMVGSDGSAIVPEGKLGQDRPHPRAYGAHVRVLGRYVRQEQVLKLEQAVYKMSGQVAKRLGLHDRGHLARGHAADVVVFDPVTVIDRADFTNPHQFPAGVHYVLVNGQLAVSGGEYTGALAGRVLQAR